MIPYPPIKPEIFSLGALKIRWYGLMYVIGYMGGYRIVLWRIKKRYTRMTETMLDSLVTYLIVGMLIGARLIYCTVYNWDVYSMNPLDILKVWEGGLSFHGATLGIVIAILIFARKHRLPFYEVADSIALAAPLGLFFGRFGNFANAELWGRATDVPWAMIFPTDPEHLPRHPSQLYEAFTEGLVLILMLYFVEKWARSKNKYFPGLLGSLFLIGYGVMRFLVEFTREPDKQLGLVLGPFSMGQVLCFLMILAGMGVFIHARNLAPKNLGSKKLAR